MLRRLMLAATLALPLATAQDADLIAQYGEQLRPIEEYVVDGRIDLQGTYLIIIREHTPFEHETYLMPANERTEEEALCYPFVQYNVPSQLIEEHTEPLEMALWSYGFEHETAKRFYVQDLSATITTLLEEGERYLTAFIEPLTIYFPKSE